LRGGATSYYEEDGLGSITSLSNAAGGLAETYTYDSVGNTTVSSGSLVNPFRFTGRDFDTETNLQFSRARYYDPSIGRFLNEDAIRFSGSVDFYSYAKNNALTFTDPFGWAPDARGTCGGTTNCNKYRQLKRYDLYILCRIFPDNPKSNCIRLCLQQNFGAGSHGVGSYNDPPTFAGAIGGDTLSALGQAYGPVTHFTCFMMCGLL
jgi:RHS repeat-associated protein